MRVCDDRGARLGLVFNLMSDTPRLTEDVRLCARRVLLGLIFVSLISSPWLDCARAGTIGVGTKGWQETHTRAFARSCEGMTHMTRRAVTAEQ
jgi:hypothetical protein